jgi:transposase
MLFMINIAEQNESNLNIEELEQENFQLKQQNAELSAKLKWFEEQYRLSLHKLYGASSEKKHIDEQLSIFNEAEVEAKPDEKEPDVEEITYKRKKKSGYRKEQLEGLPVEEIKYELPEEERICECCNGKMHEMSTEVREEISIIPAQVKITRHIKSIYGCRKCEKENIRVPIKSANTMPRPALPGSPASASAIAYVMSQKFVESMPIYRLEKHFERMNIVLSRQTMSNWMLNACERWLKLIFEEMKRELIKQNIIHCDETTLTVLREPGKPAESKSYMWLYRSGRYGIPIVLYEYQSNRSGKHPLKFLEGFRGYAHVDGYAGYNKLEDNNVILSACFSHARRAFTDALKSLPKEVNDIQVATNEGLNYCNKLFEIERLLKEETPDVRFLQRIKRSKPVLDEFYKYLKKYQANALPKSPLGKAVRYCLNIWDKLNVFLYDGRLEIDNNRAERSIKPFVIARKNFLFCNTPRGANSSSVIFSIVETAKENGLNPFEYLKFLFEKMPNMDCLDGNSLKDLLPWSDTLPSCCKVLLKH